MCVAGGIIEFHGGGSIACERPVCPFGSVSEFLGVSESLVGEGVVDGVYRSLVVFV